MKKTLTFLRNVTPEKTNYAGPQNRVRRNHWQIVCASDVRSENNIVAVGPCP